jgi:hypothetical protein
MPQNKCLLWLHFSTDWLRKQITHKKWTLENVKTYDNLEKYCLFFSSKVYKFTLDEMECFGQMNTRPYLQGVYNHYMENKEREPKRKLIDRVLGRNGGSPV